MSAKPSPKRWYRYRTNPIVSHIGWRWTYTTLLNAKEIADEHQIAIMGYGNGGPIVQARKPNDVERAVIFRAAEQSVRSANAWMTFLLGEWGDTKPLTFPQKLGIEPVRT